LTNYGEFTLEQLTQFVQTYINGENRATQDSMMLMTPFLFQFCYHSFSKILSWGIGFGVPSLWSVWLNRKNVVSNLTPSIREHCSVQRAELYWQRKAPNQFNDMDWEGGTVVAKTIPRHRQQWITKNVSGFCSVGKMAKLTGLWTSDKCPQCEEVVPIDM
jgi:hypothetical protein